jgi:hypothetical protein
MERTADPNNALVNVVIRASICASDFPSDLFRIEQIRWTFHKSAMQKIRYWMVSINPAMKVDTATFSHRQVFLSS